MKKRICNLFLILCLLLLPVTAYAEAEGTSDEIVILYTNDVHTYIDRDITYSKVAALKDSYKNVLLLDAGDHIQGTAYGSMDKGETIVKLMNAAGYDAATLGNHEFDYGMSGCMATIKRAAYTYLSCNFHHEENGVIGKTVLDAYKVFEVNGTKIAVIGITTPETFTSSTPAYFQDEDGNYIYGIAGGDDGEKLYSAVQTAIDAASAEADVVIALGHLGDDASSAPWRSEDVIANTTGLDAFIDGHSHSTVPGKTVTDEGGNLVILTQTGEYLGAVGKMTITSEGIATELLTAEDLTELTPDEVVEAIEKDWITDIDTQLGQVIGSAEVTFDNYDTDGKRLVRIQETNSGDFAADALYYLFDQMGMDVDVAIMNGGGVRNKAITGNITYKTCKEIHTFGNVACLQSVTGQQLLDALEWGARSVGDSESGSFLQVSGITYKIDTTIPNTTQADDKGVWTGSPTGEYRVHDVKVYNKDTKVWDDLDLQATYHLAGYNYNLRDLGDGFAMFEDAVNVLDYVMEDYMVLANYVQGFDNGVVEADNSPLAAKYPGFAVNYGTVNGSGRIVLEEKEETYPIWVGGEQITESAASGEGWSYDAATNTLTLENYTYSGPGYEKAAIYAESDLNINLKGENQISSSKLYGIYVKSATLTIDGDGSLNVEGTDFGIYTTQWNVGALTIGGDVTIYAKSGDVTAGSSYGIRADGAFTIQDNAVVTAQSGYAPSRSCGIYAYTTLDICDNAVVTAISGESSDSSKDEIGSYGIRTTYMTVNGGKLTTTGNTAKYDSCGIYTQTLEITGGSVTAAAGTTSNGPSIGIASFKSLDISGGTVNAVGGDASASGDTSCGIQTSGTMTVSGGSVTARTGSGGYTRAIQADRLSVTDGILTAAAADAVLTAGNPVAHSSGIQVSSGLTVEDGTIDAVGGKAANFSYGIQSAGDMVISGGDVTAVSGSSAGSYGLWAMGTINVECDEITFRTNGTPGLIGTTVTSQGPAFAGMGILVGEKLAISAPVDGKVTNTGSADSPSYTITEKDGTAAEQIEIKPLSYTVRFVRMTDTLAVPVPAGQSVNGFYCDALEIEDFSEVVNTTAEGYDFGGWYIDEEYKETYDFDRVITSDITVYGKWTAVDAGGNNDGNGQEDTDKPTAGDDNNGNGQEDADKPTAGDDNNGNGQEDADKPTAGDDNNGNGQEDTDKPTTGNNGSNNGQADLKDTGDNSNLWLWSVLLIVSASSMCGLLVIRWNKKHNAGNGI